MQIADLLLDNDDSSVDCILAGKGKRRRRRRRQRNRLNSRNFGCFWPRSIFARCFRWIKKSKRKAIGTEGRNVDRETTREDVVDGPLVDGLISESSSSVVSGRYTMESSFNLAVGFGLVYLTTIIKKELNEITELRTQMETLVQKVKETVQNQTGDTNSITSDLNSNLASTTIATQENLADSENISLFGNCSNYNTARQEKCAKDMNQLEAELEAELERLQIHLDAESNSSRREERMIEMTIEGTAPELSLSASSGKVIMDRIESRSNGQDGVSPKELEIRLHELLEARQEQRIKELQENLEQIKLKLLEKEKEVSWWKDTALVYRGSSRN